VRPFTAWEIRDFAVTTIALLGLSLAAYFVVWAVVMPVQRMVAPDISQFACLLFLPHGVRVFATSLLGGKAVPGLVLGALAGAYVFWGLRDPQTLILASLVGGVTTWAVFEGLRALQFNPFYINVTDEPPPFQTLLLAGIVASAANAFLLASMAEGRVSAGQVTTLMAAYVTGDVTGLLVVMLVAPWAVRLIR
jgi:hypothetical protein